MDHHIDRHYDEALNNLKQQILLMGSRVEVMVSDCVQAQNAKDIRLAEKIMETDRTVNALEVAIDEQCIELLARYQPAASDLRFITRGLKIVTDLERIGDLAVNFAQRVKELVQHGAPPVDISKMAAIVQKMLKDSFNAFVEGDDKKAEGVFAHDDEVDEMTEKYVNELINRVAKEPGLVKTAFPTTSIIRYLERIADHATNIAELAIFMIRGRDVRHGGAKK
jgi:phosphate transport system protein